MYDVDASRVTGGPDWGDVLDRTRLHSAYDLPTGGYVIRLEANRYDTVRQVVHSQHRYEEYGADGVLIRTSLHRLDLAYLYPADIRRLLSQTGFQHLKIDGGFGGREFSRDADELVADAW